ncbi:MAG TPA: phosphotransferase [Oscillospiraceae bacterium]|nr:phosphotransferase [Oscillospiraceae bacterium]HPF55785.1 phosphotransferase [Clostridiales bacterium]HPK35351.1 phosphotransferase [Oscillospiraceae bacterium]HPR74633.1 phosphotransferase [Oscillospiraceae bacterium]
MNQVQIINFLKEYYSIKADTLELIREAGSSAYVVTENNNKYFLRIVKPAFFDTAVTAADIQYFLQKQDFPVPKIHPAKDGSPCVEWRTSDEKHLFVLYEYIEGKESEPNQDAEAIGELIGKLHKIMKSYPGPLVKHDKPFFIGRYINILRRKQYPKTDEFVAYGDAVWNRVRGLPRGYCHGDMYSGNIHKAANGKLYVLDFDTSCEAFPVYDPVLICNRTHYFEFDPDGYEKSKAVFTRFLPSYLKHSPLSQAEIDAFFDLIAVYHFQVQATVIEINGLDCVDAAFLDRQYDWLCRWREQCEIKLLR